MLNAYRKFYEDIKKKEVNKLIENFIESTKSEMKVKLVGERRL